MNRIPSANRTFLVAIAVLLSSGFGRPVAAVDIFATAVQGVPYGVATIELPVQTPAVGQVFAPLEANDAEGRILYPISDDLRVQVPPPSQRPVPRQGRGRLLGRVSELVRELTDNGQELEQTVARRISFLFVGSNPIRVELGDAGGVVGTYEIVPKADAAAHAEMMQQWWSGYTGAAQRQIEAADYPAWVENYLVAMLAGRIGLPLPDWYQNTQSEEDELLSAIKLIGGAEAVGEAAFRRAASGLPGSGLPGSAVAATLPLPPPPDWAPEYERDDLQDVATEPLASRVPPECFYVRYGSFENYLWFRDLSDEYGGDITRMITLRGVENHAAQTAERQLNMKTTQLSRMLGPTVIEDQAIIGRDLLLTDGASMGVLFKAKNAYLLRTSLAGDRKKLARNDDRVTLKDVKIADRVVSLLSTSDNRVRSFLAEDGEYVLVSNSETLVRRFFEVGQTGQSLAATSSFRLARQLMPLDRGDTIFAYFSPAMLRELVSPEYLIELRRRMDAKADVALVHLARLAASQHPDPSGTVEGIDALVEAGYLPNGFGTRGDGSGVITVGEQVVDTLRGARGTFLPIADIPVGAVTPEESDWYQRIAAQYSLRFPSIDPIMVGIGRELVEGNEKIERITVHAEIAPWDPGKYGKIAQQLGPPTTVAMQFAPDDIVAVSAHVASPQLGPPTHLFAAVKDSVPPEPEDFAGILNIYRSLRQIPGYLGAWPQPGTLDRLPLGLGIGTPVGPGMNRLIGGVYRYTDGQFSVLSFYPEIIQASLPFLAAVDAPDSAQIRLRVGNLNGSQLEGWVNGQLYDRAREGSVAGANFLNLLTRQLDVDPETVMQQAEQVLGSRLQCPLGGNYVVSDSGRRWISTAWRAEIAAPDAPIDYVAPAMNWFRGSSASVTQYADRVVADAVVDVARQ